MVERRQLKMSLFVKFASDLRQLSTCKRINVGCIVIDDSYSSVLAIGYNGVPSGLDNGLCNSLTGSCGCIHAEANAIAKLRTERDQLIMITTLSPCALCAGLIINTKQISRVVYLEGYRDTQPITTLKKANINVTQIL